MKGYYKKYWVTKKEGQTDPEAEYFLLRLDTDADARRAAAKYGSLIFWKNPAFAIGIYLIVVRYDFLRYLHIVEKEVKAFLERLNDSASN